MKSLRLLGPGAIVFPVAILLGCQSGQQPPPGTAPRPKVAFVSNNAESFWTIAEAGTKKASADLNVEVLFRKPAQGDAALQKEIIDNLLNQGIQSIAISVIDPKNQNNYLKEISGRVPLLTQDNDAPDSGRLCYIGTDNYIAGRAVGALVKEAMPEGGTIAIFVGQLEPLNARQRRQGTLDELAGMENAPGKEGDSFGKYKLHKTYTDQPEGAQKAKENAVNCLTELQGEKNVCLIGLWAYNPPNILSAVKDQGKLGKVKIVGFDEDFITLDGIRDGHIHGTVVQQPFQFGYMAVKAMAALAKGDKSGLPKDGIMAVPHVAVTKDGHAVTAADGRKTEGKPVEAFTKELKELLGLK